MTCEHGARNQKFCGVCRRETRQLAILGKRGESTIVSTPPTDQSCETCGKHIDGDSAGITHNNRWLMFHPEKCYEEGLKAIWGEMPE